LTGLTGIRIAEKAGYKEGMIKNLLQLGLYFIGNDSLSTAREYLMRAIALESPETDPVDKMTAFIGLGYICDLQAGSELPKILKQEIGEVICKNLYNKP